jgi:F0F1-type ATP synthase membrane subunit c/vacuolar-type H+-ATPase subunit K
VPDTEDDQERGRLELAAAILLGLAAFVAAFTAYQSGKAGGEGADAQARANAALVDANFFYSQGNQQLATDNQLFLTLIEAEQRGDTALAEFIENDVMDENLQAAVDYWRTTDAATPFDESEDNPYTVEAFDFADEQQTASDTAFQDAADAGERGDTYDLAGVLLAVALFIGGIGTLFKKPILSWWLMGVGTIALIAGTGMALTA